MAEIQFPEFSALTENDWQYFLSFGAPQNYLSKVANELQYENRFLQIFVFNGSYTGMRCDQRIPKFQSVL